MKRLVLFVVASVFAFCTTVMAVETAPEKVTKEEGAAAQVQKTAPKNEPAVKKNISAEKAAKRAEKAKKEEAAAAEVQKTAPKKEAATMKTVDPKKAAKSAEKVKKEEAAAKEVQKTQ
jgi:hypothetical protein